MQAITRRDLIVPLTYEQVQTEHSRAWDALPSSYQNDHALRFFLDCNEHLCATHDLGGEYLWCEGEGWLGTDEGTW